ncbi:proline-rich protein 36 isoform X2 [Nothobranchius furzeri]|uniref:Transcript variant X3 n=1 Tax=Nothobranchius furzeri TaxID=105023 RepID=A0A9D2XJQ2_NOTFU|nr:fibrous sheath CABYR-binding protein isoform X3 [Nothobranchius furzeri]KAF7203340.1 transcript variant X3 [Nothobranchius furzeri]
MEDQGDQMDFQSVRAMFQEKECVMGQPKNKPFSSDKPKVGPPSQSPTYLPAGARPSLLTSINHALETNTVNAPRVVFREEKKESKKPLVLTNSKAKDKPDKKVKESKDKTAKEDEEKLLDNLSDQKEKRENGKDKRFPSLLNQKEPAAVLVEASAPPRAPTTKKKGFHVLKKSAKRDSTMISDPVLDTSGFDVSGPAPLIPVSSDAGSVQMEPLYSIPKARPLMKTTLPEPSAAVDLTPPSFTPDFCPPPAVTPEVPVLTVSTPESKPPTQIPSPAPPSTAAPVPPNHGTPSLLHVGPPTRPSFAAPPPPKRFTATHPAVASPTRPTFPAPPPPNSSPFAASAPPNRNTPSPPPIAAPPPNIRAPNSPPTASPTPPDADSPAPDPSLCVTPDPRPGLALADPFLVASAPSLSPSEHQRATEVHAEAVNVALVKKPPSKEVDPPSLESPGGEHPISALSVLERAEDKGPGKKTSPGDLRILNALENSRKKNGSPLLISPRATPPPEERPQEDPTKDLPHIDYAGRKHPSPNPVNDIDHEVSPVWEKISKEKTGAELLVLPPPPAKQALPDLKYPEQAPEKPDRLSSVIQDQFIPPPPLFEGDSGLLEAETTDGPEFEELASDAYSPELPSSEWGNELGTDITGGQSPLEGLSNGTAHPVMDVHSEPANEVDYEEGPVPVSPLPVFKDPPVVEELPVDNRNSVLVETENEYEDIATSLKKKGKLNNSKKNKGAPKNPYAESEKVAVQEKTKSRRFARGEKKPAGEKLDEKELKKEKHRLEREKKELKEKREREKKEQKEREKKELEMKKKFKVTGQEEAMYQAKVTETSKGRRHNLPIKSGDVVSIIRTTDCPKGKWLARDNKNNYGYVSVKRVNLDVKEMLEMGKKAARNSTVIESGDTSKGNWNSNDFHPESFTDDSEEWTCEDDDLLTPTDYLLTPTAEADQFASERHNKALSMPVMGVEDLSINHQHSDMGDGDQTQTKPEALQKLSTFLNTHKSANASESSHPEPETSPISEQEEVVSEPEGSSLQEEEFDPTAVILPPPDQYADTTVE